MTLKKSEEAISELKETIQRVKEDMEKEKQMYETQKTELPQQIRALGGKKYKETDLSWTSEDPNINLEQIKEFASKIYKTDIIREVLQEAQNQANLKDAELEGTTYEQPPQGKKH